MNTGPQPGPLLAVREIMTEQVVTITPDRTVEEVARVLRDRGDSALPVVDPDGLLIGMVSEYDVISKRGRTVGDIMSRGVISVGDETGAAQVATIMALHGIRRVPVQRDGRLVGIVSRADLVRLFSTIHWTCAACGSFARGFASPDRCVQCGGTTFRLDREPPIG